MLTSSLLFLSKRAEVSLIDLSTFLVKLNYYSRHQRTFNRVISAAKRNSLNEEMLVFAWPCSWRPSALCAKQRIALEISFIAIPKRHPMMPIANAKLALQSWQKWRVLSTLLLNHQPLIRVTLKFRPVDRSLSLGPLGPIGPRR
jgi:hypothetical protein